MAEEIINGEEVKIAVSAAKKAEDNWNRFATHTVPVYFYKQVTQSLVDVMLLDSFASACISLHSGLRVATAHRTTNPMMTGNTGPGDCC